MFGGIVSIALCVWIYQTASNSRLNPLQWIIAALIVFYGVRYAWTFGILKPLMGVHFRIHTLFTGILIEVSGVLLGAAAVALFRARVMLKQIK